MFWCSFGKSQLFWFPLALLSVTCHALESSYMTYILQFFQIDLPSASQLQNKVFLRACFRKIQRFSEILRRLRNAAGYQNSLLLVLSYRLPSATMYQNVSECWPCQFPPTFEPGQQWVGRLFQVSTEVISLQALQVAGLKETVATGTNNNCSCFLQAKNTAIFLQKGHFNQALAMPAHQALDYWSFRDKTTCRIVTTSGNNKNPWT